MFTELSASNMEAIKLHTEVKRVFKDESEAFFSERLKWKSDVKKQTDNQDKLIQMLKSDHKLLSTNVHSVASSFQNLTDCVMLTHLVVNTMSEDLRKVDVMGQVPSHDILFKDRHANNEKNS